jgi:hypothetical protein
VIEDAVVPLSEFLDPYEGTSISAADFQRIADALLVNVNAVKAVHQTEVGSGSFTKIDGRIVPKILYERHYFYRLNDGKYWDIYPDLSFPVGYYMKGTRYIKKTKHMKTTDGISKDVAIWVPFNKKTDIKRASEAETGAKLLDENILTRERDEYGTFSYQRLRRAYKLNKDAALMACSWGAFQIMGSNFKSLGYDSVRAMVKAFSRSELAHLEGFAMFIKSDSEMLSALQNDDFATFARRYNGSGYKQNSYDTVMAKHFNALEASSKKTK